MLNLKNFLKNEDGATAIEYGLIAALIAVVIIGAVSALGGQISSTFGEIKDAMVTPPTAE
jgi:pilus assembly protein Flp/PilA